MKGLPLKVLLELDSPIFRRSENSSTKKMTFARSQRLMGRLAHANLNSETSPGSRLEQFSVSQGCLVSLLV